MRRNALRRGETSPPGDDLPPTFAFSTRRIAWLTYRLSSRVLLEEIPPPQAFRFFEDPRNLFTITPPWLDFRMLDPSESKVGEGAEFVYTIRWMGVKVPWHSRIVHYHPPREFTDVQVKGPYIRWEHRHTFEREGPDTLMRDRVDYRIPMAAVPLYPFVIRRQLEAIFRYRALRIAEWARGELRSREQ